MGKGANGKEESFKAHRDVFFFTLQRELEKVNLMSALEM
jgi:CDK inhibitor PHO81